MLCSLLLIDLRQLIALDVAYVDRVSLVFLVLSLSIGLSLCLIIIQLIRSTLNKVLHALWVGVDIKSSKLGVDLFERCHHVRTGNGLFLLFWFLERRPSSGGSLSGILVSHWRAVVAARPSLDVLLKVLFVSIEVF